MSAALLEPGTGRAGLEETQFSWKHWLEDRPTGWGRLEAGWAIAKVTLPVDSTVVIGHARTVANQSPRGLPLPPAPPAPPAADLASRAAALAAEASYTASPLPPPPRLSGNLAEDVRAVCGLTWAQIGATFKISERAAAGWRVQGVPGHRAQTMEALRAIGATLVGGLGPVGVSAWLTAGEPSRLQRVRDGEQDVVVREALSYRDTPAT
jgi:hypothetical protein